MADSETEWRLCPDDHPVSVLAKFCPECGVPLPPAAERPHSPVEEPPPTPPRPQIDEWAEVRPGLFAVQRANGEEEWWFRDPDKTIDLIRRPDFAIPPRSWQPGFPPFFGEVDLASIESLELPAGTTSWDDIYESYWQEAEDQYGEWVEEEWVPQWIGDWSPAQGASRLDGQDQWCEARRGLFVVQGADGIGRWWYHDATRTVAFELMPTFPVAPDSWTPGLPAFLTEDFERPTDQLSHWCDLWEDWEDIYDTLYDDERIRLEMEEEERREEEEDQRRERVEHREYVSEIHQERNHEFEFDDCPYCAVLLDIDNWEEDGPWASLESTQEEVAEWRALYGDPAEARRWKCWAGSGSSLQVTARSSDPPEDPDTDMPLDLEDARRYRKAGMTIDQAEQMHRLPSFADDAPWRKWIPGSAVWLAIGPKDGKRRREVGRAVRSLQAARSKRGGGEQIEWQARKTAETLLSYPSYQRDESGRAGVVRGAHYQVWHWVRWPSKRNAEAASISPALALLRNDAVLHVHSCYEDAQSARKLGFWRGRYSAWSAWAQWDLRIASANDYAAFAGEADAVVAELFRSEHTPAGSMNLSVLERGQEPWWMSPPSACPPDRRLPRAAIRVRRGDPDDLRHVEGASMVGAVHLLANSE